MNKKVDSQPGIKSSLGNIPFAVTENHNEVYYYWNESGLKNSTLFHIDGHSDMDGGNRAYYEGMPKDLDVYGGEKICCKEDYYKSLSIGGFIVPGFFYGIIGSIYWLNPHSEKRKLQYMGSAFSREEGNNIEKGRWLFAYEHWGFGNYPELRFQARAKYPDYFKKGFYQGRKKNIKQVVIKKEAPLILDLDLDAFCCHKFVHYTPKDYDGVNGWRDRLDETIETISYLQKKPNLITLTLSSSPAFVPKNLSTEVLESTLDGLQLIYGKLSNPIPLG
ncbi:Uncharacterised protein [uncultured archaeon]|nr:Uncharacterised protein [uncultured archaeon]